MTEKTSAKWAEKLGGQCSVKPDTLKFALEELSESCFGDAARAKQVIEELTLKCNLTEGELRKFIKEVSRNCPMDAEKLHEEILKAEGNKENAFKAIYRTGKAPDVRSGVR